MIDTSDGLLRDATRLALASGVVLDLDTPRLTPDADLAAAAEYLGDELLARDWVLTGGEDHAMLACFPSGAALPASFRAIGRVLQGGPDAGDRGSPDAGDPGVRVDGRAWTGQTGWRHFT
jgi:thiamine-monophosphate kinase